MGWANSQLWFGAWLAPGPAPALLHPYHQGEVPSTGPANSPSAARSGAISPALTLGPAHPDRHHQVQF